MSTNPRPLPAGYVQRGAPVSGRRLQTGSRLSTNEYGLDVLSRPYRVRTDMAPSLLPQDGEADFQYADLTYSTYQLTEGANFWSDLVIEYVGHAGANQRRSRHECGRRRESVQLETAGGEALEVEYFAPFTTYRYVSDGEPRRARFTGPIIFGPDNLYIKTKRPASVKGEPQYKVQNVLEEWIGEQRGRFYEVTENWAMVLTPPDAGKLTVAFKRATVGGPVGPVR